MFTRYDKFLVAFVGAVSTAVTEGLVVGTAAKWAGVAIAAVAALGVVAIPNKSLPPSGPVS